MAKRMGIAATAAALLVLAACGEQPGEGGVTADEARQLNEAANMMDIEDTSPDSLTVGEDAGLGNGEAGAEAAEPAVAENAEVKAKAEGE